MVFLLSAMALKAQDCHKIMLPYFGYDENQMYSYPEEKLAYRCAFSRFSFYEADQVPEGAAVHDISEVTDRFTGEALSQQVSIDINVLSYYQYNFAQFRGLHYQQTVCFRTPGSAHPYLVLRSFRDTEALLYEWNRSVIK